ncbi:MAG: von Willebrand factor type A domain-containing protein [Bacteroidota bacterium]
MVLKAVLVSSGSNSTKTDRNGFYTIKTNPQDSILTFSSAGFQVHRVRLQGQKIIDVTLSRRVNPGKKALVDYIQVEDAEMSLGMTMARSSTIARPAPIYYPPSFNTEEYAAISENGFKKVADHALSTFSIDVDAASYSNVRRFLNAGKLPPKDAVRVEEMINYFSYDYQAPESNEPFSIETAVTKAPWNTSHLVARVGLQGKKLDMKKAPASNIVFLLDVSGSMSAPNKLPLLKSAFKLLANELRSKDKVAIVVYAGAAGVVLHPSDGSEKGKIMQALENLEAGGSTAGGAGIKLAYKLANEQFIVGGNNRVVLATDGDFNVGASSNGEMQRLIEQKREEGIFLTVLGFGMGNYKDSKMEILANKGNGNYAYIDNMKEAKKVLVNEFGGTMYTIAKDVKIQVEFNPAQIQAYRLIGYENRLLNNEDFNDDKKDAGELGSGHNVTALYELILVGVKSDFVSSVEPLKYQSGRKERQQYGNELMEVKLRYKDPDGVTSKLLSETIYDQISNGNEEMNWALAAAGFGMLLRDSEYKGDLDYKQLLTLAKASRGEDRFGYRSEMIHLIEIASGLGSTRSYSAESLY